MYRTHDFDYHLPADLIAQAPLTDRAASRLLVLWRSEGRREHAAFTDLPRLLCPGDLLVLNDTRVLPARLAARRSTGARIEVLLLHPEGGDGRRWQALVRPARRVRAGELLRLVPPPACATDARLPEHAAAGASPGRMPSQVPVSGAPDTVADGIPGAEGRAAGAAPTLRVLAPPQGGQAPVGFEGEAVERLGVRGVLERFGTVPLPPYIRRPLPDPERYQTVYARTEGSVAAPTAGLHFTPALLDELRRVGVETAAVTLHVGLGTFRPVTAERPEEHRLHAEWCRLPQATADAVAACRGRGGRVVAVGTTVARTLESHASDDGRLRAGEGWTDLYILPGYRFRVLDGLLTNFHLPRSTLLMLVCAFAGRDLVLEAYREAVSRRYRFFSFGDAMLVL